MHQHLRAAAVLFVFALAASGQSPAQNWNNVKALAAGTPVRVSVGSHNVRGSVQAVTDDSLAVDSGKGQQVFTRQEVMRVSVKKQSRRGRNALIGLGAGAAVGAAAGAADHSDGSFLFSRGQEVGLGAVVFGVIGTVAGALFPTGGWREVYRP